MWPPTEVRPLMPLRRAEISSVQPPTNPAQPSVSSSLRISLAHGYHRPCAPQACTAHLHADSLHHLVVEHHR